MVVLLQYTLCIESPADSYSINGLGSDNAFISSPQGMLLGAPRVVHLASIMA